MKTTETERVLETPTRPPEFFTTAEHDAINQARSRLRGYVTLLANLVDNDVLEELGGESDAREAFDVVICGLRDAINAIDTAFGEADERQGGAR